MKRGRPNQLTELQIHFRTSPVAAAGTVAIVAAFILTVVLSALDISCEKWRDFFEKHAFVSGALVTLLFLVIVGGGYYRTSRLRVARTNQAVTRIGLAGLVNPLLGIELALWSLTNDEGQTLCRIADATNQDRSPMKWIRRLVRSEHLVPATQKPGDSIGSSGSDDESKQARREWLEAQGQEIAAKASDTCSLAARSVTTTPVLLDMCIRELVGSLRDWVQVLSQTELGLSALYCIQRLRVDLQTVLTAEELHLRATDSSSAPIHPDSLEPIRNLRDRCVFLAVAFEDSSLPNERRLEVAGILTLPLESKPEKPGSDGTQFGGRSTTVVREYIGGLRTVLPVSVSALKRKKRAQRAIEELSRNLAVEELDRK